LFLFLTGTYNKGTREIMQNEVHMGLVEVFFSTRVVNRWNMLEQQIVGATSLNAFKK